MKDAVTKIGALLPLLQNLRSGLTFGFMILKEFEDLYDEYVMLNGVKHLKTLHFIQGDSTEGKS